MASSKDAITTQIKEVFISKGYEGATLANLADATGLSKASLYHHFPGGKPEMASHLVDDAVQSLQTHAFDALTAEQDPVQALKEFVEGFYRYTQAGDSNCLLAILSHHGTANEEIAPLQHHIRRQFTAWHAELAAAFMAAGVRPKRSQRRAHETIAALYGAMMNAKLHQNPALFAKAVTRLSKTIDE